MTEVKPGGVRRVVGLREKYTEWLVAGNVPTDGVQYTSVATFGTTPVTVFNKLINPGFNMHLDHIRVGLSQRIDNLKTDSVGSLIYYWTMGGEWDDPVGTQRVDPVVCISGTYSKGVATSGVAASDPVTDVFHGFVDVGSVSHAPVRLKLIAVGLIASSMTAEVKNNSFVYLEGRVIPGT